MAEHALLQLDQMVNLATENTMLARIMLLEIGQIKYRHAVQNTVRQAGVSALILLFYRRGRYSKFISVFSAHPITTG